MNPNSGKYLNSIPLYFALLLSCLFDATALAGDPYVAPPNETRTTSCRNAAATCAVTQTGLLAGCMWATTIHYNISNYCGSLMENASSAYTECGGGANAGVLKYCNSSTDWAPAVEFSSSPFIGGNGYWDDGEYVKYDTCVGAGNNQFPDYVSQLLVTWGSISSDPNKIRILNVKVRCAFNGNEISFGNNNGKNLGQYYASHTTATGCQPGSVPNVVLYDTYSALSGTTALSALGLGCGVVLPSTALDVRRANLSGPTARNGLQGSAASYTGCGKVKGQIIVGFNFVFSSNGTPDDRTDDFINSFQAVCASNKS